MPITSTMFSAVHRKVQQNDRDYLISVLHVRNQCKGYQRRAAHVIITSQRCRNLSAGPSFFCDFGKPFSHPIRRMARHTRIKLIWCVIPFKYSVRLQHDNIHPSVIHPAILIKALVFDVPYMLSNPAIKSSILLCHCLKTASNYCPCLFSTCVLVTAYISAHYLKRARDMPLAF